MDYIKNRSSLISHGEKALREDAVEIMNSALYVADPYYQVKKLVKLNGEILQVGQNSFDLSLPRDIYVIGAGKATYPIAKALDEILGGLIKEGLVICKHGQEGCLERIKIRLAAHPVPDENSVSGARDLLAIAAKTKAEDIIFCAITGGSSSLLALPIADMDLSDLQETYRRLLRCGANIVEINAVRKHICGVKGGRLAAAVHPRAHLINLTVSDVIGDMLDYITCPSVPDTSYLADAQATLDKYKLWDVIPERVSAYIRTVGPAGETPKGFPDHQIYNHIIVKGDAACSAALEKAQALGYNAMILSTMIEGESKEVGGIFAAVAKEIKYNDRPLPKPAAVIGGGETTMKINIKDPGEGGPNQQFALAAAALIDGQGGTVIVGLDTDGTDGVSSQAGGLVDGFTMGAARKKKVDITDTLARFSDAVALRELQDHIITGATGTNVNDLKFLLVR